MGEPPGGKQGGRFGHAVLVPDHLCEGESLRADVAAWCARMLAGPWQVALRSDTTKADVVLGFELATDLVAFVLRWK